MNCKRNTVHNLVKNWLDLSDPEFHDQLKNDLKSIFQQNGYSSQFYEPFFHRDSQPTTLNSSEKTDNVYFSLPYIGPASHVIKKHLCKLDPKFRIAFASHLSNYKKFFTKLKDPVPKQLCTEVIYKIPCNDCGAVYIGETM